MKNILKKIFVSSLLILLPFNVEAAADWLSPSGMTNVMSGTDDGTAHIQLQHTFPYMGGSFTDAWMSSNGFILLYDPVNQYGNSYTNNSGCCSGFNPYGNGSFSFMLAPLWTDLKDPDGAGSAGYYVKTNDGVSSFLWYNVYEYGTSNTNTFQANLWPDGSFDFLYDEVNITNHSVWVGFTGHTSVQDDVHELYYGQNGTTTTNYTLNDNMNMQLFSGQGYAWWGQDGGYDTALDCSDPLNNSACPGYQEAYFNQQCSNDALYNSQCPGYEQAYYNQQCGLDALYDSGCPGYAEAYLNQQCGLDPLYDSTCDGYAAAWLDQQCDTDPLFSQSCSGYTTAMLAQQQLETSTDSLGYDDSDSSNTFTSSDGSNQDFSYEDPVDTFTQQEQIYTTSNETVVESMSVPDVVEQALEPEPLVQEITRTVEEPIEEAAEPEITVAVETIDENVLEEVEGVEEVTVVEESTTEKENNVELALSILKTESASAKKRLMASVNDSVSDSDTNKLSSQLNSVDSASTTSERQSALELAMTAVSESMSYQSESPFESNSLDDSNSGSVQSFSATDSTVQTNSNAQGSSQQQDESPIDDQQESLATTDAMFGSQINEAFSTGANIATVLSGVRPDFSKFDVKPPSKQQAVNTKKVESLAEKMSESAVQQNMEKMQENVQDSGGFNDQTVAVVLINYVPGFDQYASQSLRSQNQWYRSKSIYKNNGNVDNAMTLYMMSGQTEQKHKQMVLEQYRR